MSCSLPVVKACLHCDEHFMWRFIETKDSQLTLRCSKCGKDYILSNSAEQKKRLSVKYGEVCQNDPLKDIKQLRRGSLIVFKRNKSFITYEHHAIVTYVNYETGEVEVVEFPDKVTIVRHKKDFDKDIKPQKAFVRHYMPLDCLPLYKTLKTAEKLAHKNSSHPQYDLFRFNCQHLASYCKTGKAVSGGATRARWCYNIALHGFQVLAKHILNFLVKKRLISSAATILRSGIVARGLLVIYVADIGCRVAQIFWTEGDAIKKGIKTPLEAVGPDVASMALTAVETGVYGFTGLSAPMSGGASVSAAISAAPVAAAAVAVSAVAVVAIVTVSSFALYKWWSR